jgi:hypothetical protein
MPLDATCPKCDAAFVVPERLGGKRIRCKACRTEFRVGGNGPADDVDDEPRPRRKPRPKSGGVPVGLIVGVAGGALVLILLVGVGFYFLTRDPRLSASRPPERSNQPAPPPADRGPIDVRQFRLPSRLNRQAPDGPHAVTLSAPRRSNRDFREGTLLEVDYKFDAGPPAGEFYYLMAKVSKGVTEIPLRSSADLKDRGTLYVYFMREFEPKGDFELWLERRPLQGSKRERVSGVVSSQWPP